MARRQFGYLRRLPSGNWQAVYRDPSGERRSAPTTFLRKSDGDAWLATVQSDMIRGTWRPPEPGSVSLREYVRTWRQRRTDLKRTTQSLYDGLLSRHILPKLGDLPLAALTVDVVVSWHADIGEAAGPTAAAQAYRLLRTITRAAVSDGLMSSTPCSIRGAGTVAVAAERRALTPDEVIAVTEQLPGRYQTLCLVLAFGGVRIGEALALRRCDVDLGTGRIRVARRVYRLPNGEVDLSTPKSVAGLRSVSIPATVTASLRRHLDEYVGSDQDAPVFTTSTGSLPSTANLRMTFRRAAGRAGVQPFPLHGLRHTAATLAAMHGATLGELKARLGHSTSDAAMMYQRASAERDAELAARIEAAIPRSEPGDGKAE